MAKVDPEAGRAALKCWNHDPASLTPAELMLAARYTLGEFATGLPGRSVEVRVPPAGAVQVLGGRAHRRGTPPAVVEMMPDTWLALCSGKLTWEDAENQGLLDASGERADLGGYFPLQLL